MHHLANHMTKICHGREQDSAGWNGVPMGRSCINFIIVVRGGNLFVFLFCELSSITLHVS